MDGAQVLIVSAEKNVIRTIESFATPRWTLHCMQLIVVTEVIQELSPSQVSLAPNGS